MQLFYLKDPKKTNQLNPQESKHVVKVLRKRTGDTLFFTDGNGIIYTAEISKADIRKCQFKIIKKEKKEKHHQYSLHLAISPTKSNDRFEWFLEKSTELGIEEITPIICQRSERKKINFDRYNKILISAMKQSHTYYLPKLNECITYTKFIEQISLADKYIAHCQDSEKVKIKDIIINNDVLILIGPEGDFTNTEIKKALEKNYKEICLSKNRLRTETAGIAAVNTINNNRLC